MVEIIPFDHVFGVFLRRQHEPSVGVDRRDAVHRPLLVYRIQEALDEPVRRALVIGAFAQSADDTRAVVNFMHDWPIPDADNFATPVPCVPLNDITYDVLISDVSGLQVPRNIAIGGLRRYVF